MAALVLTAVVSVAPPASAQSAKGAKSASSLPPLSSAAPANDPPALVPTGDIADIPPHPSEQGDARRATKITGFDPARSTFIEAETTPTRRVASNPDGSKTLLLSAAPVRFKDNSGVWRDIDLSLVPGAGGALAAKSSAVPARLGAKGTGDLATLDTLAGPIVLRHPDALPAPATVGKDDKRSQATYAKALPGGRDVVMSLTNAGIKENVVLADRSAPSSYTNELVLPAGVTAREGADGIELVDTAGAVVAVFTGGLVHDASFPAAGPASASPVQLKLLPGEKPQPPNVALVEVSIDPEWLAGPRVFPVTVDPTLIQPHSLAAEGGKDTFVANQEYTTTNFSTWPTLYAGTSNGGIHKFRSLLYFNLSGLLPTGDVQILGASLSMRNQFSVDCTPRQVQLRGLDTPLTDTATWATTSPSTQPIVAAPSFAYGATGCPENYVLFDVASLAQSWVAGAPNKGIELRAASDTDTGNFRVFYSADAGVYGTMPTLWISYNRRPAMPTPAEPPNSPADGAAVSTLTPTLAVNPAADPDGDPVKYFFRVTDSPGAEVGAKVAECGGFICGPTWTVPNGALVDGVTYWWHAYSADATLYTPPTWTRSFRVDLHLGHDGVSPIDDVGSAAVNLVSGNLVVDHASPALATVGGGVGAELTYNSAVAVSAPLGNLWGGQRGLIGEYFDSTGDTTQPPTFAGKTPVMVRRDTSVNFDWNTVAGPPGLGIDNFMVRWSGYFIAPYTGSYNFGAAGGDGFRIFIYNSTIPLVNEWYDHLNLAGTWNQPSVQLNAGSVVPIRMEYYAHVGHSIVDLLIAGPIGPNFTHGSSIMPAEWLSTDPGPLPPGWALSVAGAPTTSALRFDAGGATLTSGSGTTETWKSLGTGWSPPAGSDARMTRSTSGSVRIDDSGASMEFDTAGRLAAVTTAVDDASPASASLEWSGTPVRLRKIIDPVSGRFTTVRYGGDPLCPAVPSGFRTAPTAMLCALDYWDGTRTLVHHGFYGGLGRIVEPGGATTDFGYDFLNRITSIRSPLNADAVAANLAPNDATSNTVVAYGVGGKVSLITGPAPAAGVARPSRTYRYVDPYSQTQVDVGGLTQPLGFARKVTFDKLGRTLTDTEAGGAKTTLVWDGPNRLLSSTDSANRTTTFDWDASRGWLLRQWGPYVGAPAICKAANGTSNGTCPVKSMSYDTDFSGSTPAKWQGLSATYWDNPTRTGRSKVRTTGMGWTGAPPAGVGSSWSARITGEINLNATANLKVVGGVSTLFVDDVPVSDTTAISAGVHRIQIDYAPAGSTSMTLSRRAPGGSFSAVAATDLAPRYGHVTQTIVEDTTAGSPSSVTNVAYGGVPDTPDPAYGRPSSVTVDPAGAALKTSFTYGSFLRLTSRTMPAGNRTGYAYYPNSDVVTNLPCGLGNSPQYGLPRLTSAPSPDGGATPAWTVEVAYDTAGQVKASRRNADPWTCITYDARGRITSRAIPALGAPFNTPARTVTNTYTGANNDPRSSTTSDTVGAVSATTDLLGRLKSYSDVWGNASNFTYDQPGRLITATGRDGTWAMTYEPAGQVKTQSLDGALLATATYNAATGELASATYANGTALSSIGRDPAGRTTALAFTQAGGAALVTDAVTRSQSGRVKTETVDGTPTSTFTYDGAGRLSAATVPGHSLAYGFAASGNCGLAPAAGKNTNRTSVTDNGGPPITYCYDRADRLTSSSDPAVGTPTYDPHGNTRTLGAQTLTYDGSDRHMGTTAGTTTVAYVRDATDRIVSRTEGGVIVRYGYNGPGDSSSFTTDSLNLLVGDRTVGLVGGVMATKRLTGDVWNYPNIHGDFVATADPAGAKRGSTITYDPYGKALSPADPFKPDGVPDNSAGNYDYGWLGQHQRGLEHAPGLATIEMGARPYVPSLGRFLEVDPVEGGSCTDYDYVCGDPVNNRDLEGTHCRPWHPHHCVSAVVDFFQGGESQHEAPSLDDSVLASDPCSSDAALCAKGGRQNKRLTGDQPGKEDTPEQQKRKGTRRSSGGDGRGTQQKKPKQDKDAVIAPCGPTICEVRPLWELHY